MKNETAYNQAVTILDLLDGMSIRQVMLLIEKHAVHITMTNAKGNISAAARRLGIKRTTLAMRRKKHGFLERGTGRTK